MAKKANVRFQNLPEIIRKIQNVGDAMDKVLLDAVKEAGGIVESDMQARANKIRKSGGLQKEIAIKGAYEVKDKHKATAYIGPGGKDIEYAFHVEVGTKDAKAQPYARPSVDKNRTKIKEVIIDKIMKAAERGAV